MAVSISLPAASSRARSGNRRRVTLPSLRPKPRNMPRIDSSMLIIDFCSVHRAPNSARNSCAESDLHCTGRNQPMRINCAMPSASRRSVLIGMAFNAPFTWRVSISTASSPAAQRCRCNHCDRGPASSPMPVMLTFSSRLGFAGNLRLTRHRARLVHHADSAAFERHVDADKIIHGFVLPSGSLPPTGWSTVTGR